MEVGLARGIDRVGLVEGLSAHGRVGLALTLLAAVVMVVLRVGLVFVVPGWLLGRAVNAWRERG